MKHTPGPWSIHEHMGGESVTDCLPAFTAHTIYIGAGDVLLGDFSAFKPASGESDGWPRVTDFEVNRANARLVIAAPKLLEALADMIEAADSMRGTIGCIQGRHPEEDDTHIHEKWAADFLAERAEAARAAIAKATGEQA